MLRSNIWVVLAALCLGSCADPARKADHFARQQGFQSELVAGSGFQHRLYRNRAASVPGSTLHVYIEGDGTPFLDRTTVAPDPTPVDPLMLQLMALDPSASVYLGRPCYFGLNHDGRCTALYWTTRRFSPEVVDSLEAVVREEAVRANAVQLELYGHSGGATLAVLLAARLSAVTRVVTIGANLDIKAWARLHGHSSLTGSLNPTDITWRAAPPPMLHLVGSNDSNTPPSLIESAVANSHVGGKVQVIDGYTHNCCWPQVWPGVLTHAASTAPQAPATAAH
ncbi:MAG TPA: hypothetical protein VKB72_02655 [Steroidobacteraceae bacterium]|nr:hypothetical protein [Steroidobacteraceae bacterium]